MQRRMRTSALAVSIMCGIGYAHVAEAQPVPTRSARSAPLVGTVAPSAIGPAAPTATPLGGLRTVPLRGATPSATNARPLSRPLARAARYPLRVVDAPYSRSVGIVVPSPATTQPVELYSRATWIPTSERPRWVVDSAQTPVQAWRDLIVTDVVCNNAGTCLDRQQRVRARWIARCDCYAFADGWNRIWRVE